jgi:hypothetical protein
LVEAESLYGESGVAERLGMKVRMWQLVKRGDYRLSSRTLGHVLRSFPLQRDNVLSYLRDITPSDREDKAAA